jgi:hypothetical protein
MLIHENKIRRKPYKKTKTFQKFTEKTKTYIRKQSQKKGKNKITYRTFINQKLSSSKKANKNKKAFNKQTKIQKT